LNGVTKAIPYPQPGFNCNADYGMGQKWSPEKWKKRIF
jgi:hypothetical protein